MSESLTTILADTPDREAIRDAVAAVCDRFDDHYWREKDETAGFPFEFSQAIAEGDCRARRIRGSHRATSRP